MLPAETAALVEDAASEIARFDTEMGHEIAPLSAVLLRTESAASSKIENLTASARAIAEAELRPGGQGNPRMIVANVAAMTAAIDHAGQLDAQAILAMHEALLGESAPEITGRWRDQQVWIGGGDYGPHGATFVPPQHRHVESAIDDLVAFINRDDIPVVAHVALAHAQFETIHPFPDGNGRVGRALLHAHLRNKRLVRHVTIPVSAGLLTNTEAYFDAITRYGEGDPIPIVERLARGALAWRVTDLLVQHPVVDAPLVAAELETAQPNVYRALAALVDAGVLVEFTGRQRDRMWRAPEVLEALDRFAVWPVAAGTDANAAPPAH